MLDDTLSTDKAVGAVTPAASEAFAIPLSQEFYHGF
jgi:hypothetical protein